MFLDELKAELEEIKLVKVEKTRKAKIEAFCEKLASLTFLESKTCYLIQFNVA